MNKKIIFFDGDGTLWYPKATKRSKAPHWVYTHPETAKDANNHLMITPTTLSTLKKLKKKGILTIVLSTHPHLKKEADIILNKKITHFSINHLFDEIHTSRKYESLKGQIIQYPLIKFSIE